MAEKGLVIDVKENNIITVKMKRKEACAKCRACAVGLTESEMIVDAENDCGADVGEWVSLELTPDGFITALFVCYGLPLVGFLVGLLPAYFAVLPILGLKGDIRDILSFVIGLVGAGIAFAWIRKNQARWQKRKYKPIAACITEAPLPGED